MADSSTHIDDGMPAAGMVLAVLAPFILILNLPPLIWHTRARNTAAVCLVSWAVLINLISTINVIIWPYIPDASTAYLGEGLCDVEVKFIVARSTGLPAATLCLARQLAKVLDTKNATLGLTKKQKRMALVFDLSCCLGLPLLTMIFHYLVQYNRYILMGVSGCHPSIVMNWTALFLMWLPPLIISLVAAYYAALVMIRLHRYRTSFATILASASYTKSRFIRLFAISAILISVTIPLQIFLIVWGKPSPEDPSSFTDIHNAAGWNTIDVLAAEVTYDHWIGIACGALIFILFGLGKDAKDMYKKGLLHMGFGGCFPWLLVEHRSPMSSFGSSSSSRAGLRAQKNSVATADSSNLSTSPTLSSPMSSMDKTGFVTETPATHISITSDATDQTSSSKGFAARLHRFNPWCPAEKQHGFELPVFHKRDVSVEEDSRVLVSKEIKRESMGV